MSAGFGVQHGGVELEAVLGKFVAVAGDGEEHLPAKQRRIVECNKTGTVGDEADVIDGFQFHQRHAAPVWSSTISIEK